MYVGHGEQDRRAGGVQQRFSLASFRLQVLESRATRLRFVCEGETLGIAVFL